MPAETCPPRGAARGHLHPEVPAWSQAQASCCSYLGEGLPASQKPRLKAEGSWEGKATLQRVERDRETSVKPHAPFGGRGSLPQRQGQEVTVTLPRPLPRPRPCGSERRLVLRSVTLILDTWCGLDPSSPSPGHLTFLHVARTHTHTHQSCVVPTHMVCLCAHENTRRTQAHMHSRRTWSHAHIHGTCVHVHTLSLAGLAPGSFPA